MMATNGNKFVQAEGTGEIYIARNRRRTRTVVLLQRAAPCPSKIAPSHMGDLEPHLIHGSWAHASPQPKRHLNRFSRFYGAHDRDRQVGGQTDHATSSVNNRT